MPDCVLRIVQIRPTTGHQLVMRFRWGMATRASATMDALDAMDCGKVLMRSTAPGLGPQSQLRPHVSHVLMR